MAKDAQGHGSDASGGVGPAHQSMVRKLVAAGQVHAAMAHAVTGYDRQQQARAQRPGGYYNPNAIGHYLGAVQNASKAIAGGVSHADAINQHFNGPLANRLHKALGTGGTAPKY